MSENSLLNDLGPLIVTAMKQKEKIRLSVLRMLKTALTNEKISARKGLSAEAETAVVGRLAKQRIEAAAEFRKASRDSLADKEELELEILREFLPQQLDENEISSLIDAAISGSQASGPKDMGAVMKILAPQIKGRADGKSVSAAVVKKLSSI